MQKKTEFTVRHIFILTLLTIVGMGLLWAVLWKIASLCGIADLFVIDDSNMGNYLAMLQISYSTIFLSTSLLGMLSDKGATVYWVNVNDYVLVNPRFFNFFSLSIIGFVSLFIETIAIFQKSGILFDVCFCVGIVSIIIIFFKMIGSGFNHSNLKKALEKKYKVKIKKMSAEEMKDARKAYKEEVYIGIWKNTEIAGADGKCKVIDENISFIVRHLLEDEEENTAIEKLENIFLILNRYGVLEREIELLWKMPEVDEKIKSYVGFACMEEPDLINIWDRMKDRYFYDAIDGELRILREPANAEFDKVKKEAEAEEYEPEYSWNGAYGPYMNYIRKACGCLSVKRNNADDLVTFLSRIFTEKPLNGELRTFEEKLCECVLTDVDNKSDGTQEVKTERGNVLSSVLDDRLRAGEGVDRYLDAVERLLFKESFINNKFCFVVPYMQQTALFDDLLEKIGRELKKDFREEHLIVRCFGISKGIIMQRDTFVRGGKEEYLFEEKRVKNLFAQAEKYRDLENWKKLLDRLYRFVDNWTDDINDKIQQIPDDYWDEENKEKREELIDKDLQEQYEICQHIVEILVIIIAEIEKTNTKVSGSDNYMLPEFQKLKEAVKGLLQEK